MIVEGRVLPLEGGRMTTLTVRAQEQAVERHAANLAQSAGRDVGMRHAKRRAAAGCIRVEFAALADRGVRPWR
jgi:hypothetical protein